MLNSKIMVMEGFTSQQRDCVGEEDDVDQIWDLTSRMHKFCTWHTYNLGLDFRLLTYYLDLLWFYFFLF